MGQITATRNLVATKVVRLAGQLHAGSSHHYVDVISCLFVDEEGLSVLACHQMFIHIFGRWNALGHSTHAQWQVDLKPLI